MVDLDPASLDLPTLTALAGAAANEHVLGRVRSAGFAGVRISHGYLIQHLIEATPTIGRLAELLGVTQQAASKAVAELEGLGIVERQAVAGDSRIRRVALTARGQDVLKTARAARRDLEASVAREVGDLDRAKEVLVALLAHSGGLEAIARRRARLPSP